MFLRKLYETYYKIFYRIHQFLQSNPIYVLRNYHMQIYDNTEDLLDFNLK
jgi:hypothetical protein